MVLCFGWSWMSDRGVLQRRSEISGPLWNELHIFPCSKSGASMEILSWKASGCRAVALDSFYEVCGLVDLFGYDGGIWS